MGINIRINRYYKKALAAAGLLVAFFVSMSLVNLVFASDTTGEVETQAGEHLLSIHDEGVERVIVTDAKTISEALEAADIEVDPTKDVVEPALDTDMIASKYNVNIYRAKPVTVVDGNSVTKIATANQTPTQIAKDAGIVLYEEDEVEIDKDMDRILIDGPGASIIINRATPVKLSLFGKTSEVRTMSETVGELLKEKEVELGKDDVVSVDQSARIRPGMHIEVWRNGKQTVTVEEEIDFPVEKIQDANREAGYREVKEAGEKGKQNVTYEIEMKNGKEISRKKVASVTTKHPKKQVEVVGAKFNYTGGKLNEAQIQALGSCESGMTPTRNSGNGFYGAFQFMPSTWRSVAPAPYNNSLPHEAPLDAQKQAVQNLLSRASIYTQFPACARQMQANGIL